MTISIPSRSRRFVTKGELSLHLGVSVRTIERWTAAGLLPCATLTGMHLYDVVGTEDFILSLARRAMKHRPKRHKQQQTKKDKHI